MPGQQGVAIFWRRWLPAAESGTFVLRARGSTRAGTTTWAGSSPRAASGSAPWITAGTAGPADGGGTWTVARYATDELICRVATPNWTCEYLAQLRKAE